MPGEAERFWAKVKQSDGCWTWTASLFRSGYGRFSYLGGAHVLAHRYSYELNVGPIPLGALVLHRCDVRQCVRPDHLYLGDHAQNMRDRNDRGRTAGMAKTECVNGHPYDDANTARYAGTGRRYCRACDREKKARAQRAVA